VAGRFVGDGSQFESVPAGRSLSTFDSRDCRPLPRTAPLLGGLPRPP